MSVLYKDTVCIVQKTLTTSVAQNWTVNFA